MDKNDKVFSDLQQTLTDYADASGKLPSYIIKDKAKQFILGSNSEYGKAFKGVYERTKEHAPIKGEIKSKVIGILKNGGGILVSKKSIQRAELILDKGESGLFKVTPRAVIAVQVDNRGRHFNRNIKRNKNRAGVNAILGLKIGKKIINRAAKRKGEVVLNRQSLSAAFEIRKRESARGYSAVAYLASVFKKFISKLNGKNYYASMINPNAANNEISTVFAKAEKNSAYLKIVNFTTGANKAGNRNIVDSVLKNITDDMKIYISKKLKK